MRGELQHAAMLLGAANALWRPYQHLSSLSYMESQYHRFLPLVRAQLAPADFDAAWAAGQRMTLRQVMADVMAMEETARGT